jgi:hypothetical protein
LTKASHYPAFVALLCLNVLLSGCGVSSSRPLNPANTTPSGVSNGKSIFSFLEDSPADNVVAFRIDVTGATLSTGAGTRVSIADTTGTFPMVRATQQFELRHLNLAPTLAFHTSSIPGGDYKILNLSFANPQLTVRDRQGNITRVDGSTAPSVQLSTSSVSIPLALSVNGPVGLMLDFNLRQSIMIDAKGNYIVDPVIIPSVVGEPSSTSELQDAEGQIVSLSSANGSISQFGNLQMGVQLLDSGKTVHVTANSDVIDRSGEVVNLQVGQMIELSAQFQKDGTFRATEISPASSDPSLSYKGVVSAVQPNSSGDFSINMILQN